MNYATVSLRLTSVLYASFFEAASSGEEKTNSITQSVTQVAYAYDYVRVAESGRTQDKIRKET